MTIFANTSLRTLRPGLAVAALALSGLAACTVQPPPGPVLHVPHGTHAPQWVYPGYPHATAPCYSRVDRHREIRTVDCPGAPLGHYGH